MQLQSWRLLSPFIVNKALLPCDEECEFVWVSSHVQGKCSIIYFHSLLFVAQLVIRPLFVFVTEVCARIVWQCCHFTWLYIAVPLSGWLRSLRKSCFCCSAVVFFGVLKQRHEDSRFWWRGSSCFLARRKLKWLQPNGNSASVFNLSHCQSDIHQATCTAWNWPRIVVQLTWALCCDNAETLTILLFVT